MLTKNTIKVNGKTNNSETLNNLLYQHANKRLAGVPLRLYFYNLARPNIDSILESNINARPKKRQHLESFLSEKQLNKYIESRKGLNNWFKKTGEAPVILDENKADKSLDRIDSYYINNGWFDVDSHYNITRKDNKRASVEYDIKTGPAFIIDSIYTDIKTPIVDTIYQKSKKEALIATGQQYRTANFESERERIATKMRNSGLYHFKQDYITFEMDTIGTNKKVNVGLKIQNREVRNPDETFSREPFKVYQISDVNIITDYTFENRNKPFQDSIRYAGFNLYSYGKMRYRPKAITDAVFITPNRIFRDIDRTRTYRYISELRTFKYPNIQYYENAEDKTLSDTIKLTPLKKFSLGFSTDVSQSNIQTIGLSLNPSVLIRNIFRGAETFQISAFGSIGSSKDKNSSDPFFDIKEYGLDLKLTIPRLFSPFYTEGIIPKYMSPSTRISLSTSSQTNIGLDKQTLSGTFNYNWYPNDKVTNKFDLFNIQYVRNLNIDNYFGVYQNSFKLLNQIAQDVNYIPNDESLSIPTGAEGFITYALDPNPPQEFSSSQRQTINNINERKKRLTENNLILSSNFSFVNDERTNLFDEDFSIFRFKLELAGNLLNTASKLIGLPKDDKGRYELFNVAYSQYTKAEVDYIKHFDLGKKNVLAFRGFVGIAVPYGNSTNIPFAKSFFAGGPNDNRAWTAYSLGPGRSLSTNEFNEANFKISFNVEQRFNLFENLNGAIFVDVGNIWNVFDDITDPNATFNGFSSLEDLAVGSGFGLRYDFSFFVFRFDIGFKTHDPAYDASNRWFNEYNFKNATYNIGINYPF
ncbi:BamA/TamA family outer membrane protein [Gaetbulibacter aestuarii]